MQVGDREQALLGPVERAVGVGDEGNAGDGNIAVGRRHALRRKFHRIASFTNSSAASASSASAASP